MPACVGGNAGWLLWYARCYLAFRLLMRVRLYVCTSVVCSLCRLHHQHHHHFIIAFSFFVLRPSRPSCVSDLPCWRPGETSSYVGGAAMELGQADMSRCRCRKARKTVCLGTGPFWINIFCHRIQVVISSDGHEDYTYIRTVPYIPTCTGMQAPSTAIWLENGAGVLMWWQISLAIVPSAPSSRILLRLDGCCSFLGSEGSQPSSIQCPVLVTLIPM